MNIKSVFGQLLKLGFEGFTECIRFRCLTILNYVVHNINDLAPSVAYYIFKEKNILNLFISLLELRPWIKTETDPITKKTKFLEYRDNIFQEVETNTPKKLNNLEALLWMSIHIMVSLDVLTKYNENNYYSRNQLLKTRKLIDQRVMDQLPILYDLRNYLDRLTMVSGETKSNFSSIMVFSRPSLIKNLEEELEEKNWKFSSEFLAIDEDSKEYKKQWQDLIEMYFDQVDMADMKKYKAMTDKKSKKQKKDMNGKESAEEEKGKDLEDDLSVCAKCGEPANKICSNCKKFCYCSKICQKKDVKSAHKNECQVHSDYVKKVKKILAEKRKKKKDKLNSEKTNNNLKDTKVQKIEQVTNFQSNEEMEILKSEVEEKSNKKEDIKDLKKRVLEGEGNLKTLLEGLSKYKYLEEPSKDSLRKNKEKKFIDIDDMEELD